MSINTVYLITGGNKGIGLGLTAALLLRPNHTVIATVRNESTSKEALNALPKAEGSKLIITYLDLAVQKGDLATLERSTKAVISGITTAPQKISKIDVLISNAGFGSSYLPCQHTTLAQMTEHYQINTLGPLSLFQSCYPLFREGSKFIAISSSLGSIGESEPFPALAYGVSKAGLNFLVRKVHLENEGIVTLAVHPGWVKTDMGQGFADAIGFKEPTMELKDSVDGVLKQIDGVTKATTSGTFIGYDGQQISW